MNKNLKKNSRGKLFCLVLSRKYNILTGDWFCNAIFSFQHLKRWRREIDRERGQSIDQCFSTGELKMVENHWHIELTCWPLPQIGTISAWLRWSGFKVNPTFATDQDTYKIVLIFRVQNCNLIMIIFIHFKYSRSRLMWSLWARPKVITLTDYFYLVVFNKWHAWNVIKLSGW